MHVTATITFQDILDALDLTEIPGVEFGPLYDFDIEGARVSDDDAFNKLDTLGMIPDEPEDDEERYFDTADIADAFDHLGRGEVAVARALFQRAFDGDDDVDRAIEEALRKWPTGTPALEMRKAA